MTAPARIWTVTYCGNVGRPRVATVVVKIPYGGVFAMTELLTRMVTIRQIRWFALWEARPGEIAMARESLERWLPALMRSSERTRVDWTA